MKINKKAALHNLECKVNAYETEAMQQILENAGYEIVPFTEYADAYEIEAMQQLLEEAGYEIVPFEPGADIYVINTCTVTNIADRKSRQMLHKAKKMNPDAIVVGAGCYVQTKEAEALLDDTVDIVIGNNKKHELLAMIEAYENDHGKCGNVIDINHEKQEYEEMFLERTAEHTRAFIKVQDGCNQFCSYCIIPYVRGRVRSRKPEDIVNEVKTLAATGVKEVVLTGIHISSYGTDLENISLIELIEAIHEIEGIKRIRLGSLEPRIITEEFAKRIAGLEKICPHFHLSLQSGCDKTLKAMNRKYNTDEYYEGCVKLREVFDNPAITTDVIVGFPGETEEDFLETRKFLEKVHFYEMHIFKYSRRKGTVADKMKEQVADTVKSERSAVLLALEKAQSLEYRKMYIGKRLEVLIEELTEIDGRSYYTGYTKNYIRVAIDADEFKDNPVNDIYECMADKLICDGVTILARCN